MMNNEMIKNLAEKCNVTLEEAKTALEVGEWNMLTAAQLLEDEKLRRAQEIDEVASGCGTATAQAVADETAESAQAAEAEKIEATEEAATTEKVEGAKAEKRGSGLRNLGEHIRRLVACGNRNRFVVRRNGATLLELPVTVLAVLMLLAFWTCIPLLVIGLFLGCRYSFSGKELGREGINNALGKAASAAERVKESVARA